MSIGERLKKIEERAQSAARAKQSATGWLNVAVVLSSPIVYPLLFSLWGNVSGPLVIIGFVIAISIHGVLAYLAQTISTADNFYFDYRDLERAHSEAEEKAGHLASQLAREEKITGVIRLMLVALSKFATFGRSNAPLSPAQVKDQIGKLMIPLVASREVIPFNGARYNFAIYLYDDQVTY